MMRKTKTCKPRKKRPWTVMSPMKTARVMSALWDEPHPPLLPSELPRSLAVYPRTSGTGLKISLALSSPQRPCSPRAGHGGLGLGGPFFFHMGAFLASSVDSVTFATALLGTFSSFPEGFWEGVMSMAGMFGSSSTVDLAGADCLRHPGGIPKSLRAEFVDVPAVLGAAVASFEFEFEPESADSQMPQCCFLQRSPSALSCPLPSTAFL